MKKIMHHGREYEVTETPDKFIFKDQSKQSIKFNFSFSKDPEKNKIAKEGLTIFFTELFMG